MISRLSIAVRMMHVPFARGRPEGQQGWCEEGWTSVGAACMIRGLATALCVRTHAKGTGHAETAGLLCWK